MTRDVHHHYFYTEKSSPLVIARQRFSFFLRCEMIHGLLRFAFPHPFCGRNFYAFDSFSCWSATDSCENFLATLAETESDAFRCCCFASSFGIWRKRSHFADVTRRHHQPNRFHMSQGTTTFSRARQSVSWLRIRLKSLFFVASEEFYRSNNEAFLFANFLPNSGIYEYLMVFSISSSSLPLRHRRVETWPDT